MKNDMSVEDMFDPEMLLESLKERGKGRSFMNKLTTDDEVEKAEMKDLAKCQETLKAAMKRMEEIEDLQLRKEKAFNAGTTLLEYTKTHMDNNPLFKKEMEKVLLRQFL